MNDEIETLRERLTTYLADVLHAPDVKLVRSSIARLFVSVTSETFENMDDGLRQEIVWQRFLDTLNPDERRRLEFVFTYAPSELAEPVANEG